MKYIDLHCDTAYEMLYNNRKLNRDEKLSVDIEKLIKGNALAQVFACFIDIGEIKNSPYKEFELMHNNLIKQINNNKESIKVVTNYNDLINAKNEKKVGAFLSIEEGEVLEGNIDNISKVYDKGIRFITLTWNYKNSIGYPNYNYLYKDKGLTDIGKQILLEMEYRNIVPDVSHLSDQGFYDVIELTKKPIIATHSNSRQIKKHPRNLTDNMIHMLSDKGGIMGMNFCSDFVASSEITYIDDLINHIDHIKNVGGIDVIALGSDFDGIENQVEIKNTSEMNKLAERLLSKGFTENEVEKIFYKNAERFIKDTLG